LTLFLTLSLTLTFSLTLALTLIGLRQSSHSVDSKGEKSIEGGCNRAVTLAGTEKEAFKTSQEHMKTLIKLFGKGVENRVITDLIDAALPSVCHNRPLPCASDPTVSPTLNNSNDKIREHLGGTSCLSVDLLSNLMTEADRSFCLRYTGLDGGSNATKLSTYPFMAEILSNLKRTATATAPESSSSVKVRVRVRVMILLILRVTIIIVVSSNLNSNPDPNTNSNPNPNPTSSALFIFWT
jgi:hypothetical protein